MKYIHNEILSSWKKGWNPKICHNVDGTEGDQVKQNKSKGEGQILDDLTHLWKTDKTRD